MHPLKCIAGVHSPRGEKYSLPVWWFSIATWEFRDTESWDSGFHRNLLCWVDFWRHCHPRKSWLLSGACSSWRLSLPWRSKDNLLLLHWVEVATLYLTSTQLPGWEKLKYCSPDRLPSTPHRQEVDKRLAKGEGRSSLMLHCGQSPDQASSDTAENTPHGGESALPYRSGSPSSLLSLL